MFYVWQHHYGRKFIAQGPAQGLLEWPQHRWCWSARTRRKDAAIDMAKALPFHARVTRGDYGETVFDNGLEPGIPPGWYPADAQTAMDERRAS